METLLQLRCELLALAAALLVMLADLVQPRGSRRWLGWFSGLLAAAVLAVVVDSWTKQVQPAPLWEGAVTLDRLGFFFKGIFILGVAVVSVASTDFAARRFRFVGEYYGLLFLSATGMMLMVSAGDLLSLYLGIELTTLSLYALAAYGKLSPRSGEAGLKYIVLGATASAVFLFGASLVYGVAGTTRFAEIGRQILPWTALTPGLAAGGLLVLAALAFKIAAAPFHMWAPDVYQGAPTPVTAFLSTASKAAGFAAIIRILLGPMLGAAESWITVVIVLSSVSMVVGNLIAISQKDIKRMLAYSGIAQAGYALAGVASSSEMGIVATGFFLFQYLFTNIGAFLVVTAVGSSAGNDEIASYNGLCRRSPLLALAMLVFLLSLGGIPPLAGFWGKLYVFWAAAERGLYGLVFLGVLASVLSLYYYLMVARAMYIEPAGRRPGIKVSFALALGIAVCALVVVGLAYPTPLLHFASGGMWAMSGAR